MPAFATPRREKRVTLLGDRVLNNLTSPKLVCSLKKKTRTLIMRNAALRPRREHVAKACRRA